MKKQATQPITFTPSTTILANLAIASDNPRANAESDCKIGDLAESIATLGLIQPLVVRNKRGKEKEEFHIIAGRRRFLALKSLLDAGIVEPSHPISILLAIGNETDIAAAAIADNEAHIPFTQVETWNAVTRMAKNHDTHARISSAIGVDPRAIPQMIALANLPQVALDAFTAGKINMSTLRDLTRIQDPETRTKTAQGVVDGNIYEYQIRNIIQQDRISPRNPVILAIGMKAYTDAGGTVSTDLFASDHDYIDNLGLATSLYLERIAKVDEAAKAAGFTRYVMHTRQTEDEFRERQFYRPDVEDGIESDFFAINDELNPPNVNSTQEEIEHFWSEYTRAIQAAATLFSDEDRPHIIVTNSSYSGYSGHYDIIFAGPQEETEETDTPSISSNAQAPKPVSIHAGLPNSRAQADSQIASRLYALDLAQAPQAAMIGFLAASYFRLLNILPTDSFTDVEKAKARKTYSTEDTRSLLNITSTLADSRHGGDLPEIMPQNVLDELNEACGHSEASLIPFFSEQNAATRLAYFALIVANSVDATVAFSGSVRSVAYETAAALAENFDTNPTAIWTPDETWFKRLTSAQLRELIIELDVAPADPKAKKKDLVQYAMEKAAEKRWLPTTHQLAQIRATMNTPAASSIADDVKGEEAPAESATRAANDAIDVTEAA